MNAVDLHKLYAYVMLYVLVTRSTEYLPYVAYQACIQVGVSLRWALVPD